MRPLLATGLAIVLAIGATLVPSSATLTPPEHQRPADQTFLTFPEWFLVFSPAEYAAFTRDHDPSDFPFLGHIRQFWESYHTVWEATHRGPYAPNPGYHLMIVVIGTSTTGEYAFRSAYETLIGRLAELTRRHGPTDEERFAARAAQQYVDFIRVRPWYDFDFMQRLADLWRTTSLWGPDPLRKWERKYALTSEYASKAVYGWMIRKATKGIYEEPQPVTAVIADRVPPGVTPLRRFGDGSALLTLPRYEGFTTASTALARQGVQLREIAGNRGLVLVSVLVPAATASPEGLLLRQPILTRPGTERLLIAVPVASLSGTLNRFAGHGSSIEHVFDF